MPDYRVPTQTVGPPAPIGIAKTATVGVSKANMKVNAAVMASSLTFFRLNHLFCISICSKFGAENYMRIFRDFFTRAYTTRREES